MLNNDFEKVLKDYDYRLPKSLIAQEPASPRDAARLLVYERKTGKVSFDSFRHIGKYLPKNAVLVFNETKVLPARLVLEKETGGKVRILYVKTIGGYIAVLADREIAPGMSLKLVGKIYFTVVKRDGKLWVLKPSFPVKKLYEILEKYGLTPLPPYIKSNLKEKELREKYQAVFAHWRGSVAAPTASLHFTRRLILQLKQQGISVAFVTLHVNLGTFAPLTETQFSTGALHGEYYEISKKTATLLNLAKHAGHPIVAVGTTVARALESAATGKGELEKLNGETSLFIREGYAFKFVDSLITNFHVPRSSLLMLVAAFAGRKKILELYKTAIKKRFKFFSFGDGMFIK